MNNENINNESENFETINDIKKKKKELSEKAKTTRQDNMKKAIEQKKLNKIQRDGKKDLEKKIKTIFNSDNEEEEQKKNILDLEKFKDNIKQNKNIKIEENDEYKNNLKNMMSQIENINKRVEKLYLIKKNKKNNNIQEIKKDLNINIENDNEKNKIDKSKRDLLELMKIRMYNQY